MGYAVYENGHRWCGYGVPAVCDRPNCSAQINRGLAYICGGDPHSDKGCGLFFCEDHLWISTANRDPQMCERCLDDEPPFDPKPDTVEWMTHMLADESWDQWRSENPGQVAAMRKALS